MAKNIFGKTRDINKPYAEYLVGDIVYRILKTYKMEKNEDNFSRWFTSCNGDYGDEYKVNILDNCLLIHCTKEWFETYHNGQEDEMPKDLILSGELMND